MGYTKCLSYAYPTSEEATKLHFGKVGCFIVRLCRTDGSNEIRAVLPTQDKELALKMLDDMPQEADKYCLTNYPGALDKTEKYVRANMS